AGSHKLWIQFLLLGAVRPDRSDECPLPNGLFGEESSSRGCARDDHITLSYRVVQVAGGTNVQAQILSRSPAEFFGLAGQITPRENLTDRKSRGDTRELHASLCTQSAKRANGRRGAG